MILLFLSGCAIPLQISNDLPDTLAYTDQNDKLFVQALSSEPLYRDSSLDEEAAFRISRGYSYKTIREFEEYLKQEFRRKKLRESIVENWIKRVKKRYKLLGGE